MKLTKKSDRQPEQNLLSIQRILNQPGNDTAELLLLLFQSTTESIMVSDHENRIVVVNQAFTNVTGYTQAEVQGKNPAILSSGKQSEEFYRDMWRELEQTGNWSGEIWNRRKNGEEYPEYLHISTLHGPEGKLQGYAALFNDISIHKAREQELFEQANFDHLTGLPNRSLFLDRLKSTLAGGRRYHKHAALLFIDLDKFKWVNDHLGHRSGDMLLKKAGERLKKCLRESDTVARLGGDEFTVILPEIPDIQDAEVVADQIVKELTRPYELEGNTVAISGSVGIAVYPEDGENAEELMKNADTAMYSAKNKGRATFRFFKPAMNQKALERKSMENDLGRGIELDEFFPLFEPIVSLNTGRVAFMEVRVYWNHPARGLLPPEYFRRSLEDAGLAPRLGARTLRHICRQLQDWHKLEQYPSVALRLSSNNLEERDFAGKLAETLRRYKISGENLLIGVPGEVFRGQNSTSLHQALREIRDLNIRLFIDNYGGVAIHPVCLQKSRCGFLKLARDILPSLENQNQMNPALEQELEQELLKALLNMAHTFNIPVIVPALETAEQLRLYKNIGVDYAQGSHFSKPMHAAYVTEYLTQTRRRP